MPERSRTPALTQPVTHKCKLKTKKKVDISESDKSYEDLYSQIGFLELILSEKKVSILQLKDTIDESRESLSKASYAEVTYKNSHNSRLSDGSYCIPTRNSFSVLERDDTNEFYNYF